ncbi:MAG: hypothetical protein ACP5MG_00345 [Verrucomicrobiia bacterium]
MKTKYCARQLILFYSVILSSTIAQAALSELPSGFGLSAKYPGDKNLQSDPSVLLYEDFENGGVEELNKRWESISNKDGKVLTIINDSPEGSEGKQSLRMTATLNQNTGGHLYKRLPREVEQVYARFYVKFSDPAYIHHFVTLGGYRPATRWPQGGAGERPRGDERITVGIEPYGNYGKAPPPGIWNFYCYWWEMKGSADGRFWGNSLKPEKPLQIVTDRWQCVEVMLKLNSEADKPDGELALWIDGEPKLYVKKGVSITRWTGMGFTVVENAGEPFEGFRWRKSNDLKLNFFWLLHYVTENAYRQNNVSNPPKNNSVVFDNIVVATQYIGPIKPGN